MKSEKEIIQMTREEFDKFMCETYPDFFVNRNLPMNQTCMCWGFDIGKGWYYNLYTLCEHATVLRKYIKAYPIFDQVKEKYGSARYYVSIKLENYENIPKEEHNFLFETVYDLAHKYQNATDNICAECGEHYYHGKLRNGSWILDICKKCLEATDPEGYKKNEEDSKYTSRFDYTIDLLKYNLTEQEVEEVLTLIETKYTKSLEGKT